MMWIMLACVQATVNNKITKQELAEVDSTFTSFDSQTAEAKPEVLSSGFMEPMGLIQWSDSWLVADRSANEIVMVSADGSQEPILSDIAAPHELLAYNEGAVLSTSDKLIFITQDLQVETILPNRSEPYRLTISNDQLFWFENNSLWMVNLSTNGVAEEVLTDLATPYGMTVDDNFLYVSTQDDKKLWRLDRNDMTAEEYHQFADIPYMLWAINDDILATTRSFRWPYGGWIVAIHDNGESRLSESPPEANYLLADDESIIWSSKQSITIIQDDSYRIIAGPTAVGDMKIKDGHVFWTDHQNGSLYSSTFNE